MVYHFTFIKFQTFIVISKFNAVPEKKHGGGDGNPYGNKWVVEYDIVEISWVSLKIFDSVCGSSNYLNMEGVGLVKESNSVNFGVK